MIELEGIEGIEELGEHPDQDIVDKHRSAEKDMQNEENQFDAAFSSHLIVDDTEYYICSFFHLNFLIR